MYKLNNKIEQVIDYCEKSNFAIINGKITNLTTNNCIADIEKQRLMFCFGNDYVISKDIRGNSFIINTSNLEIDNVDKVSSFAFPVLSTYKDEMESRKYIVYNYLSKEIIFETTEWIGRDIIDNYIFSSYQNIITCRTINNGNILWQFDLSQLGTYYNTWDKKDENYRVEKFIGIYNEILYVALNLYSETIIAIDIKTGKLLNQWKNIPFTLGANLDTEQQQIFGLIKKEFWQINLETAEFTKTNIHPVLQNIEFENVRDQVNIPITDTHYVIKLQTAVDTANSNRIYDGLALFNKHTQQIDWHYLFGNETWLASNEPKITTNKIFQLSNEGNLFIFEKTSNENV